MKRDNMGVTRTSGDAGATRIPLASIVAEAERLITAARQQDVPLRLLGGLAVRLHVPAGQDPLFTRDFHDIDLFAPRKATRETRQFLEDLGYEANTTFNALHGKRRLMYFDPANDRRVDVFVGEFSMCHAVPISDSGMAAVSIPLAELLLTKLQVVKLNRKDQLDILTLLFHHEMGTSDVDDHEVIDGRRLATILADDWGLWRTATLNIQRTLDDLDDFGLDLARRGVVARRLTEIVALAEAQPKSRAWRMRNRIGDHKRWYEEPDDL